MNHIAKGKPLRNRLRNLNLFMDHNGILRAGDKLRNANVSNDGRHPILLLPSHDVTYLIIREAHESALHGTANIVRQYLRIR